VRDSVDAELLAPMAAKGKSAPLTVYRLVAVLSDARTRTETPLVGRADDLARLERAFSKVSSIDEFRPT